MRLLVARIGSRPQLTGLVPFFQVSCHHAVVRKVDKKPLLVTGAIPQLIGFDDALFRQIRLSSLAIPPAQPCVSRCEFGVDLSSSFEEGQSGGRTSRVENLPPHAIGFQRFK